MLQFIRMAFRRKAAPAFDPTALERLRVATGYTLSKHWTA